MNAHTVAPTQTETYLEFHQRKALREAIGREISRNVEINEKLAKAKFDADEAVGNLRMAIREAAQEAMKHY